MTPEKIVEIGAKIEAAWLQECEKYIDTEAYCDEVTALVLYAANRFITNFIKNLNIEDYRSMAILKIFNETILKMLRQKLDNRKTQKEVH